MHHSLYDQLAENDEHRHFRASFLQSKFCMQTTMQDILDDPDDALDALSTIRGVGETSMSRLRQFLVREYSTRFPRDWQAANNAVASTAANTETGTEAGTETSRARALAHFITVWDVVAEFLPITGRFYPDYSDGNNRVLLESLVRGERFIYACESFPELLKTSEVLFAEQGHDGDKASYSQHLSKLRDQLPPMASGSLVMMNPRALEDLLTGGGHYKDLPEAARTEQMQLLLFFSAAIPHVETCITDYRKSGLSSGFLSGEGPLLHYCFGGYVEVPTPDMVQVFHDRIAKARQQGQSLRDWITAHGDHPVAAALR